MRKIVKSPRKKNYNELSVDRQYTIFKDILWVMFKITIKQE